MGREVLLFDVTSVKSSTPKEVGEERRGEDRETKLMLLMNSLKSLLRKDGPLLERAKRPTVSQIVKNQKKTPKKQE